MPPADTLQSRFFRHVTRADVLERDPEVLRAIARSVQELAGTRRPGQEVVRVLNPVRDRDGWTSRHTVVQVCTDDMPFLVDSVLGEMTLRDSTVHVLLHPQLVVRHVDTGVQVLDADPVDAPPEDAGVESWMHLEVDRIPSEQGRQDLAERLERVLRDVRKACTDWHPMRERVEEITAELRERPPSTVDPDTVEPAVEFLEWVARDHFTFLGYREYDLVQDQGVPALRSVPGTGLGILRTDADEPHVSALRPEAQETASDPRILTITKANSRATVHRPVYMDYLGVRRFDEEGNVVGERRILGLFTASAYAESVGRLPVIGDRVHRILEASGFAPGSHSGKDLMQVLEHYPRDELFQADLQRIADNAHAVLQAQERRQTRVFVRKDEFGRFVSVLVFMPRDRLSTSVRLRIEELLVEAYGAVHADYTTRVGEWPLAQIHYVLRMPRGGSIPDVDVAPLEERAAEITRGWHDRLVDAMESHVEDEAQALELLDTYSAGLPEAYKEDFDPLTAVADLRRLHQVVENPRGPRPLHLYRHPEDGPGERRLKLYRPEEIALTDVLPIFGHLGVKVTDERPYTVETDEGEPSWIYDFGLRASGEEVWEGRDGSDAEAIAEAFEQAFAAVWGRQAESDALNSLVLLAGLHWRQVVVLRAMVRYLRQVGTFSLDYLEEALTANPAIARMLVDLFDARFDPDREGDRDRAQEELVERIEAALDKVASLDQDRILRALLSVLQATLRTNVYQLKPNGDPKPHVSLKLQPRRIPTLPEPRPAFEIWVYAPRVEGVHLRFGKVARGGLRWSDRREDFRTEILGLVKAQMVKNAVIVPTGSKGGFFAKELPDPTQDREAWLEEGRAAYTIFIKGLLDITDNRVGADVVPPERVVRHDEDDPYLVVAADKGTATFSDLANGIAREFGFWLDDAFASGGSAGYDHKGMGITARGAWESTKRHFRELGLDTQSEDFTVVGIGDMSGDVFGNGMLLSEHIRLVAAFDHRHVFLDPDPDAATSYAERRRLFDLPRSSWADYDESLISEGGGVYARSAKSVPVSPQVREVLGLPEGTTSMTPNELLSAVLRAPADLLWNGGIGTYVKASTESHADVGDRSNDAIRVDGADLRVRVAVEGGNLGFTQRGRIEAAEAGVRINTDAIDNSAGVDTSDHEVNIKIALTPEVREERMSLEERNELLASMTDEVASRVLRHNYEQNVLLGNGRYQHTTMLPVHHRLMRHLEEHAGLDRALEFLPDDEELARRVEEGLGLTSPEFSVLVAYSKLALKDQLLDSELPDLPHLSDTLVGYFPEPLQDQLGERLQEHPLRREIVVNEVANQLVNRGGVTFAFRAAEETGATSGQIARAFVVCRDVFRLADFVAEVEALDTLVPTQVQTDLYLEFRRLLDRAVRWFLNNQSLTRDLGAEVERFAEAVAGLDTRMGEFLHGTERERWQAQRDRAVDAGVPDGLASWYAGLLDAFSLLDIVEIAEETGRDVEELAAVYFAVSEAFGIDSLLIKVARLVRQDQWTSLARGALRDDLYGVLRALTRTLVQGTESGADPVETVRAWSATHREALDRVSHVLGRVREMDQPGMAPLSVALRTLRGLVRQGAA